MRRSSAGLVLVVEDDEGVRDPLEQFLRMRGFDVVSADTAEEGVEAARRHQPDAAIVDLQLKRGSGRDVIVRIPTKVPVIIFSGMQSESWELERLRPRTRMIEKPYSLPSLVEILEEMLARAKLLT